MSETSSDDIYLKLYREVIRFGVFLSVVGVGITLYFGGYGFTFGFVSGLAFFVFATRQSPYRDVQTDAEQNGCERSE